MVSRAPLRPRPSNQSISLAPYGSPSQAAPNASKNPSLFQLKSIGPSAPFFTTLNFLPYYPEELWLAFCKVHLILPHACFQAQERGSVVMVGDCIP